MKIEISKDARDWLAGLSEPKRYRQVVGKILSLLDDTQPADSQELKGYNGRRTTVGEYRIVYQVDQLTETIKIILIGKRNDDEIYKRLKR